MFGGVRRTAKDWLDRPMTSWHLITGIFVLLLCFGLLMELSASSIASYRRDGSPFTAFHTQALFAVIGLFGFFAAHRLSIKAMRRFSLLAVGVSLMLLTGVLAAGNSGYGAKSWITVGPFNLQPSELAKLSLLVWMSHVLAARRSTLRSLRSLLFPVLPIFLLMVLLIMLQPDLGTTVTLALIFVAVLWFGGAPLWVFAVMVAGALGGAGYLATSAGYRNARILAWLHPGSASASAVFQINQSLYGLGHGGVFGVGLGQSLAKAGWLPNADSDFIFAVIGEELGLVGAGLLVLLYALLAYTGLRIARRNVDPFIKIVASSATIWLVGQAAINIGYVVGLLPVTGLTLPMISRGGTSLVVSMMVFGMLANFARREPQAAAALHSQGPGRIASFLGLAPRPPKPPKVRPVRQSRDGRGAARRPAVPAPSSRRAKTEQPARQRVPGGQGSGRRVTAEQVRDRRVTAEQASGRRVTAERASGRRVTAERARDRRETGELAPWQRLPGSPPTPPRLRRSGDRRPDEARSDASGRAFVDPPPDRGHRAHGEIRRADLPGRRPDGDDARGDEGRSRRRQRIDGDRDASGGRGRAVRR